MSQQRALAQGRSAPRLTCRIMALPSSEPGVEARSELSGLASRLAEPLALLLLDPLLEAPAAPAAPLVMASSAWRTNALSSGTANQAVCHVLPRSKDEGFAAALVIGD